MSTQHLLEFVLVEIGAFAAFIFLRRWPTARRYLPTPAIIAVLGICFVAIMWWRMDAHRDHRASDDGMALECLFTGLGFVLVLVSLEVERIAAAGDKDEHRELLAAIARQTEMSARGAYLAGISARIEVYNHQVDRLERIKYRNTAQEIHFKRACDGRYNIIGHLDNVIEAWGRDVGYQRHPTVVPRGREQTVTDAGLGVAPPPGNQTEPS